MAWNGHVSRERVPHRDSAARQRQLLPPHAVSSPGTVPGLSRARLPATYQAAQKAILKCARIDECKSWSDKAAALASYARQARDHTLRVMAERIHARAVRRCGELLKDVPSGQGSRNQHGQLPDRAVTRQEAARHAGLSERQKVTALRLAALPVPKFEALIEGDSPLTVTQLAELGRSTRSARPPKARRAEGDRVARARDLFHKVQDFCEHNEAAEVAREFADQDGEPLQAFVATLRRWLDEFAENLPEGGGGANHATSEGGQ